MIEHKIYQYCIVSLLVALFWFTGCTYVLKVNEMESLQIGSPLRSVLPKTFAFKEFKDIRNVDDPLLIRDAGLIKGTHLYVFEQPPAVFVGMWIKKELERNGHKCVTNSSETKADFIVEGIIYKYAYRLITGMFSATQTANTGVKITISRVPPEKGVFVKSFEGEYTMGGGLDGWKITSNQALFSMIKEFSRDEELVDFIKK